LNGVGGSLGERIERGGMTPDSQSRIKPRVRLERIDLEK